MNTGTTYLINNFIEFSIEQYRLKNIETNTVAELGLVTGLLLTYLFQNAGKVSTRNEILEQVFSQSGVSATDGNLNQHIMLLRRAFTELQCKDEIIITVPKIGFRIGDIDICVEEASAQKSNTEQASTNPKGAGLLLPLFLIFSAFFLLLSAGYYYMKTQVDVNHPKISISKTVKFEQCEINYTRGTDYSPPEKVIAELNQESKEIDCAVPTRIYLWRPNSAVQHWAFTAICNAQKKCRGEYVHVHE